MKMSGTVHSEKWWNKKKEILKKQNKKINYLTTSKSIFLLHIFIIVSESGSSLEAESNIPGQVPMRGLRSSQGRSRQIMLLPVVQQSRVRVSYPFTHVVAQAAYCSQDVHSSAPSRKQMHTFILIVKTCQCSCIWEIIEFVHIIMGICAKPMVK